MKNLAIWSAFALLGFLAACQNNPQPGQEANASVNPPIDTITGRPIPLPNPWENAPCDLLTDEEFYRIFSVEEKRDVANRRALKNYCLRTWKKPDWRDREVLEAKNPNIAYNPESALAITVLHYDTRVMAQEQMNMNKRDRVNGYAEEVPNVGEMALWSNTGGMLIVMKNATCFQIQLNAFDNVHDNLPKAVEVAQAILAKIK
jgi:hypothetical protein